ncbi:MAG: rsbU 6 [Bacteroidota bacterium]|jgi:ligand-binding sensor domain-containing protein/serine phosphatase RsbU (regulator of sigma subunit)|nr:rsbU 6 [Bacteroidota bacterium]
MSGKKFYLINKWCCSLVIFFCSLAVWSQNIKFKRLNIEEGLSAVTVNTIFQDSQDFIWIGTQDGLNRYDGYHFKTFKNDPFNTKSISSNDVKCIYEDNSGIMYFGSNGGGLSIYNKYIETFQNLRTGLGNNTLSNNNVNDIIGLNNEELLISTDNGLNLFNKSTKTFKLIPFRDTAINFTKFFKDSYGSIWVGSESNYIFEFDATANKLINYELPSKFVEQDKLNKTITERRKNIYDITQRNGELICGSDGGLLFFNLNSKTFTNVFSFDESNRYNNRVKCFVYTTDSTHLYFGTWGGLVKLNLDDFTYTVQKKSETSVNSLSSDKISSILKDKQNNLWIGTEENGLNIYFNSLNKFPLYNASNGLQNDFVYSICQLKNKNILVGTEDGLYSLNPVTNKISSYNHLLSKHEINTVLSLLEDEHGKIWIGSYGQGIIVYNPVTQKEVKLLADKNLGGTVMKIIQDKSGVIWVATYKDGLYSINPNTYAIRRYTTEHGLSSNNIYYIYENKENSTLLVGTDGGGMCIIDFVTSVEKPFITVFKHSDNRNSISSNSVNSIYKARNGIFWIATSNGLNKFDLKKKHFTVYSEKDGLPNSYIYDVIPDKENNLWLPSNAGLTKFNPYDNNEAGSAFINYNTNDGLQAREFNQGASFLCKDGKILVGGVAGLNYFDPSSIKKSTITPRSYIYSYSRQGKNVAADSSIAFQKRLELTHKENYFTFELIALDYVSTEKTKFMYYLEGYDKDWSSPTSVRFVSYTELPGGDYTFKVKATNSDGVWNEVPTELKIKVIPPWWKTTWFYILSFIFIIAAVFGFTSYRTNAVKKENKILENKVAARTKELAEKNRDITSSIEYAKRIQEAILPAKDLIYNRLKKVFILYKPKDIVSGDFYWFGEKDHFKIIAVVDCTGHGVPGAFMSMIGHNLLNQIVSEKGISNPGQILEELHRGVQAALKQNGNGITNTNDGMDVSILALNTETRKALWAGAFRSLVIVKKNGELEKIDGNKYPVGGSQLDSIRMFTPHQLILEAEDCLYMFSDGYADQFGGAKGKKFMVKQFHENLKTIHNMDMFDQHTYLEMRLDDWKGNLEQIDDVLVIGIKV